MAQSLVRIGGGARVAVDGGRRCVVYREELCPIQPAPRRRGRALPAKPAIQSTSSAREPWPPVSGSGRVPVGTPTFTSRSAGPGSRSAAKRPAARGTSSRPRGRTRRGRAAGSGLGDQAKTRTWPAGWAAWGVTSLRGRGRRPGLGLPERPAGRSRRQGGTFLPRMKALIERITSGCRTRFVRLKHIEGE
jgi:hypothetical protein